MPTKYFLVKKATLGGTRKLLDNYFHRVYKKAYPREAYKQIMKLARLTTISTHTDLPILGKRTKIMKFDYGYQRK
jgi:hypothetical protein